MKRLLKIVAGLAILLAGAAVAFIAFKTRPVAEKVAEEKKLSVVKVEAAKAGSKPLWLPSQGLIEPRMKTVLAAEVSGKVIFTEPNFEAGGEFSKDDTLITIDPTDYSAAVAQAEATLAEAELALETELARQVQAKRDWERLGGEGEPSDLTLRIPNVRSAEARKKAARTALAKAETDLKRTEVKAPFDGRIESIETELGAFLLPGTPVAEVYSTAPYEIRLPLSLDEWTLLERDEAGNPAGDVMVKIDVGGQTRKLAGKIVRTEGRVDRESRSVYVVAEIGALGSEADELPLQPGLFAKAEISGRTLENVIRVPVEAFRDLDEVMVVGRDDNIVSFRSVKVLWRSDSDAWVSAGRIGDDEGIEAGEWLSLIELSDVISGKTEVKPIVVPPETDQSLTGEIKPRP